MNSNIIFIILCGMIVGSVVICGRLQEECATCKADCIEWPGHNTDIVCRSHDCTFVCNGSTITLYMNKSMGTLENTGYLKCSVEGQEVSFDAVGVPQEKVRTGINFLNVTLDSTANMTLTVNSLRAGFDNSDPPLCYHVEVIELPTESPDVTSAPPGMTTPGSTPSAISQPVVSDSATCACTYEILISVVAILGALVVLLILIVAVLIVLLQKKRNGVRDKLKCLGNNGGKSDEKPKSDHDANDILTDLIKEEEGSQQPTND